MFKNATQIRNINKSDIVKKYPEIKDNPYKYIYHYSTYKTKEKPEENKVVSIADKIIKKYKKEKTLFLEL